MDTEWWRTYRDEVNAKFQGERWTCNTVFGVRRLRVDASRNSGAGAIVLAASQGARRIILLGYDCKTQPGLRHWHGDHPGLLGNCGSLAEWPGHFDELARRFRDIEIINCSRDTALMAFPRAPLEGVLNERAGDAGAG